ncbi:paramyosin, long form-like [Durio zibethinus]|uniref:Paramyosin, long form-like n=1 Tax=Durio zibethinus TaxID=66656 RepID=A0A6P6A8F2_DURZI|nr:paramyosin, long form-like [Durio zibethinus]
MELQIENKASEAKQLGEQNMGLQFQISKLEVMSKNREEELLSLTKKLEDNEKESLSRAENLTVQINNLLVDMESLRTQKAQLEEHIVFKGDEASTEIKSLMGQINTLQQELESLHGQKAELEVQLERKTQAISDYEIDIEKAKEEIVSKTKDQQRDLQEKEGLLAQVKGLEFEVSSLKNLKGELEEDLRTKMEENGQRREENVGLQVQIKEVEAQVTSLELELESLQATNRDMELQIENKASESKQLGEQNMGLQSQISELEVMSKKREEELLSLTKKFEDNEKESLSRVENLTVQINNLLVNMESLRTQKAQLEELIVLKGDEASTEIKSLMGQINTLQQELESLHGQKAELVVQLERKTQSISDHVIEIEKAKEEIVRKIKDQQKDLQEKEGLLAQVKDLEFEINSLKNLKGELEEDLRTKIEENSQLREEKVGLQGQIFELEKTLAERGLEFTALQEKHTSAENETSSQLTALVVQVNNLQQELDSLQIQRNELELQLEREKQEASERLTDMENQKSELVSQISNQQRMLEEQGEAYKKLAEEYKDAECLYQECKANLEVAERKKEEMSEEFHRNFESKSQMAADLEQMVEDLQRDLEAKGDEKNDFINQITDHQRMLKEQEDAFNKLSKEYKQLETSFQDCKAIIEVTERKMQEMAGEHNKNVQSKNQIAADLEQIIEDLKRDLEMKGDELSILVENVRTIEVKLRLSNQKLRITEQLLTENEESFKKAEAKFLEEQSVLEQRITTLSGIIAANDEAYCRMITDISENVNSNLTGFEAVIQKLEEGYRNYELCIKETLKELRIAKHWAEETKSEKKRLTNEVTNLIEQLKDQKEQESMMRERVEKLQIKANKEEGEKENLLKAVNHLEKKVESLQTVMKEKDQGILGLGEEKREAIRQLCLWIDYHRSRCDDLKEILLKTVRFQRAT